MILTVTVAPGIDVVYQVDVSLAQGAASRSRVAARSRAWFAAGKGINVARGVRDLGHDVRALALGGGAGGRLLEELMRGEGLLGDVVDASSGVRVNVTVSHDDEELHIVDASAPPSLGDLEELRIRIFRHLGSCTMLVISGHCPPPHGGTFVTDLLEVVRARSVRTIVDTRNEALLSVVAGGRPWLLKPNQDELGELAGAPVESDSDVLEAACRALDTSGATYVLVSLGGRGALMVGRDGAWRAAAPQVPVVNTVGAGDAMVAAVATSPPGAEPSELLRRAVAAGTANVGVSAPGAVPPAAFANLLERVFVNRVG